MIPTAKTLFEGKSYSVNRSNLLKAQIEEYLIDYFEEYKENNIYEVGFFEYLKNVLYKLGYESRVITLAMKKTDIDGLLRHEIERENDESVIVPKKDTNKVPEAPELLDMMSFAQLLEDIEKSTRGERVDPINQEQLDKAINTLARYVLIGFVSLTITLALLIKFL